MFTLVTGASGHVGNNLVRALLDEGRNVRVLTHRNSATLDKLDVEKIQGDVRDADSLTAVVKGADTVYHLAALVSIETSGWDDLHSINTLGTRNIARACLNSDVRRLVHFSSIDAVEQKPVNIPVDENSPPATSKKHPPYDRSKAAGETEVRLAIKNGLNAVIVNPTSVIGPFDFHPSHQGQMLISMAGGKLPALVEGGFDWVDVRDVVFGAIQAEKLAPAGSKYILGGRWASLAEIAGIVEANTGTKQPSFTCPLWLASAGAPVVTALDHIRGRRPLFTRASIIAVNSNRNISHQKAESDLNYHPRPLEQTICDTLAWMVEDGRLHVKPR